MSRVAIAIPDLTVALEQFDVSAMSAAQKRALTSFAKRGFPGPKDEDWKYTDLSNIAEIKRAWLLSGSGSEAPDLEAIRTSMRTIDAEWIVIANGRVIRELSPVLAEPGLELHDTPDSQGSPDGPLADLNLALLQDSVHLRISGDRTGRPPLGFMIADTARERATCSQVRLSIELMPGSSARFVERHQSVGDAEHYSNCVLTLKAGAESSCDYLRLQQRGRNHSQTTQLRVRQSANSQFRHAAFDLGGKLVRNDLHVELLESGASCSLDGLYLSGSGQHIDNHARVDHCVGPTISQQEYRGILTGRSRAVWNGKAIVHKGADGADATQANHNLLLSEQAEINTKPELEIYADDVKCAHGTTVGQLDEKALFYLRTRGMEKAAAEQVLTFAFAAALVERTPIFELHELLRNEVEVRLQGIVGEVRL
jgi:Fe-S cluster assembly protein SufD